MVRRFGIPTVPRRSAALIASLVCLGLSGCGDDHPAPVASVPAPAPDLGLKAVLADGRSAPVALSGARQGAPPMPGPQVAAVVPGRQARPVAMARGAAPATVRPVAVAQASGDDGRPQGVVPHAFETTAQAEQAAPQEAASYAQAAPSAGPVNDLLSVLQSGSRARQGAAPALVPGGAAAQPQTAPQPAADPSGAAAQSSVDSVRASVRPGSSATSVLAAPGMVVEPDERVRQALDRRRRAPPPSEAGLPPSQKDLEGLF